MSEDWNPIEERKLEINGTGMYYIDMPDGSQVMIMMRDGKPKHLDVHNIDEGFTVSLFTDEKVSKKTKKLTVPADKWTNGFDFKVVKLTVGE